MLTKTQAVKKNPQTFNFYEEFKACTLFYARFHLIFLSCLFLQLLLFFVFFPYLSKSAASAFIPAFFLLTLFSYLVILFFFQTKRPMQLLNMKEKLSLHLKAQGLSPLEIADAIQKEAFSLIEEELSFYSASSSFTSINPVLSKLKIRLHWQNFHLMKELLFLLAIDELTNIIKKTPLDPTTHIKLTETYKNLSLIYLTPAFSWIPVEFSSEAMESKFQFFSERAIEEITVLQDYGIENSWIHSTLAEIYHLQKRPENEIKEYETLLEIMPENEKILFQLGMLYFQEGLNSKGLKVYEKLLTLDPSQADQIINYYGSYTTYETSLLSSVSS